MKLNMKRNAVLFVEYFEKNEDNLIKVDEIMVKIKRKEFEESLNEDLEKGMNYTIEYVNKKPEKVQMGAIYILQTPKGQPDRVYSYQLNG